MSILWLIINSVGWYYNLIYINIRYGQHIVNISHPVTCTINCKQEVWHHNKDSTCTCGFDSRQCHCNFCKYMYSVHSYFLISRYINILIIIVLNNNFNWPIMMHYTHNVGCLVCSKEVKLLSCTCKCTCTNSVHVHVHVLTVYIHVHT